jgi:hypothetical protein
MSIATIPIAALTSVGAVRDVGVDVGAASVG